jgi:hypothetical protein
MRHFEGPFTPRENTTIYSGFVHNIVPKNHAPAKDILPSRLNIKVHHTHPASSFIRLYALDEMHTCIPVQHSSRVFVGFTAGHDVSWRDLHPDVIHSWRVPSRVSCLPSTVERQTRGTGIAPDTNRTSATHPSLVPSCTAQLCELPAPSA